MMRPSTLIGKEGRATGFCSCRGHIERAYGDAFCASKALGLMSVFRRFLSFVEGAGVGYFGVHGTRETGDEMCLRWGSEYVDGTVGHASWLRYAVGVNDFSGLYSRYHGWATGPDRFVVQNAIDWYVQANHSAFEMAVPLFQTAMERLCKWIIKKDKTEPMADTLTEVLRKQKIPVEIPSGFADLKQFRIDQAKLGGQITAADGPWAFVRARNVLGHGDLDGGKLNRKIFLEAQWLGQWYVELLLLSILDYRGSYHNRVEKKSEKVPWAS